MSEKRDERGSSLREAFGVVLKPAAGFLDGLARLPRPFSVADQILSGRVGLRELGEYIPVAVALSAILGSLLPVTDASIEFVSAPIVNEVLVVASFLLAGLLSAIAIHKPLRMAGGKANFHDTFVASVWIATYYYPVATAAEGLIALLSPGIRMSNLMWALGVTLESVAVLAGVHRISVAKTLTVVLISELAVGGVLGFGIAVVQGLIRSAATP